MWVGLTWNAQGRRSLQMRKKEVDGFRQNQRSEKKTFSGGAAVEEQSLKFLIIYYDRSSCEKYRGSAVSFQNKTLTFFTCKTY